MLPATKTARNRPDVRSQADDPVQWLRVIPNGPIFSLADVFGRRKRIVVGRSPEANWTLAGDKSISAHHCLFKIEGGVLKVQCLGAKNRTVVDGVSLVENSGFVETFAGSLVILGDTRMLVCGRAGEHQSVYIAPPLAVLIQRIKLYSRHAAEAARRLGVAVSTVRRWFREGGRR